MTFKSFLVHLQTTDWQSLCSGGRHTPRLQDVLSSVMVRKLEGEDVSFPKIILRPHFKKEKPKAFWRGGDEGGREEKNAERRRRPLGAGEARWGACFLVMSAGRSWENIPSQVRGGERPLSPSVGAWQEQNQRQQEGQTQVVGDSPPWS